MSPIFQRHLHVIANENLEQLLLERFAGAGPLVLVN